MSEVAKWLSQLLRFRAEERRSRMEFNGYSNEDDVAWCNEDAKIRAAMMQLSQESTCDARELTLDEAIQHAQDVASKSETSCAKNHLQLASWLSELKSVKTKFQYLAADFDNYKKRVASEKSAAGDAAKKSTLLGVLSVVDDMERLVDEIHWNENLDIVSDNDVGYEMIYEKFMKWLAEVGCVKIDCQEGDKFDVNLHEAISVQKLTPDDKYCYPDTVSKIVQNGWMLDGKLLRATKVVVYQA